MTSTSRASGRLRRLLAGPKAVVIPAAYDCLSALAVERAGFEAVLHGGLNAAASTLGFPDDQSMTLDELALAARRMARSVEIPVLADIDDGYGGPEDAAIAARAMIDASAGGIYVEDQAHPRRSPSLGGSDVIAVESMTAKLAAIKAVCQVHDPEFVVVARTHGLIRSGRDAAITRGEAYLDAGADGLFVDVGYTAAAVKDLEALGSHFGTRTILVANMSETVGRPLLDTATLEEMGFRVVLYPVLCVLSAMGALGRSLSTLRHTGTSASLEGALLSLADVNRLLTASKARRSPEGAR